LKTASSEGLDARQNVLLCTPTSTYEVRQVQSSNITFVTVAEPHLDDSGDIAGTAITAVAQAKSHLELFRATPDTKAYFAERFPTFDGRDHGADGAGSSDSHKGLSRAAHVFNAPFSQAEFEQEYRRLCVFELNDIAMIPSGKALLGTWASMLSTATICDCDMASCFEPSQLHNGTEGGGCPTPLVQAILFRLSSKEDRSDTQGVSS